MEQAPIISTMPEPPKTEEPPLANQVPASDAQTTQTDIPQNTTPSPASQDIPLEMLTQAAAMVKPGETAAQVLPNGQQVVVEKIAGGYTWTRHILLFSLILLSLIIIASLIYLNGKSIYQYGL